MMVHIFINFANVGIYFQEPVQDILTSCLPRHCICMGIKQGGHGLLTTSSIILGPPSQGPARLV